MTEVHAFKLNNERYLKSILTPYFDRIRENVNKFYLSDNFIYDASSLTNKDNQLVIEAILSLYYLKLFSGISGQSTRAMQDDVGNLFDETQIPLLSALNSYLLNRIMTMLNEIRTTINRTIESVFTKTILSKLDNNGILQFQTFNNPSIQVGAVASELSLGLEVAGANRRAALLDGEETAGNIANDIFKRNEYLIDYKNKEPINRNLALGSLIVLNQNIGKKEVASEVDETLKKRFDTSIDRIAMTETQVSTETYREDEVQITAERARQAGQLIDIFKVWRAILDDRVRLWHEVADGQRVSLGEPFIVNGEKLRYPGDSSLGASANNIIKCRCEAEYNLL